MPAIWPNWRSSGAATDVAIVSALAPASVALTWMVGKSTWGKAATGKEGKGGEADKGERRHQSDMSQSDDG